MRPVLATIAEYLGPLIVVILIISAPSARAQLSVSPTYILFDDQVSTKAITVENAGTRKQVFRVSLLNYRMLPDGTMERVLRPATDEHFADSIVRFSPRQFELGPRESAVIRLQVPPLQQRPKGEYRTHIVVQQVPGLQALDQSPVIQEPGVSVDLRAVFGIAVPLVMRAPNTAGSVKISRFRLTHLADGRPAVALALDRSGERSVRGELVLLLDGKTLEKMDGIAVYAPAARRNLLLALPNGTLPSDGRILTARFRDSDQNLGTVDAEAKLPLH